MCKFPASERTQKRRFSKPRIVTHSRTHGFVRASRHTKKWVTRAQEARAKKIRRLYLAKCEKISAWVCTSKQIFSKLLPWRPGLANASFLAGFPTQLETSQREHRRREHRKFGGFTPWLVQISSEEMHLEANIFKTSHCDAECMFLARVPDQRKFKLCERKKRRAERTERFFILQRTPTSDNTRKRKPAGLITTQSKCFQCLCGAHNLISSCQDLQFVLDQWT